MFWTEIWERGRDGFSGHGSQQMEVLPSSPFHLDFCPAEGAVAIRPRNLGLAVRELQAALSARWENWDKVTPVSLPRAPGSPCPVADLGFLVLQQLPACCGAHASARERRGGVLPAV